MSDYQIKISPESIVSDIVQITYSGGTVGVYISMQNVLSGGTNGSSILTGLTIPVLLIQDCHDSGFYSVFDGDAYQMDVVNNFIYSGSSGSPYTFSIFNTSDVFSKKYLELCTWSVNWGDGSPDQDATIFAPNFISHVYPTSVREYVITLTQITPWGINIIQKTIITPFTEIQILNPQGTIFFNNQGGSWSGILQSYNYIFSGDSANNVEDQITSNFTTVPFLITGTTRSRLNELIGYGPIKFSPGAPIIKGGEVFGVINALTSSFSAYTIQNVIYYDYPGGTTLYIANSSGLTSDILVSSAITKNETLLKAVSDFQVNSDVIAERGANSGLERVERLGEINNLGDLVDYGYGYFVVVSNNQS